MKLDLTLCAPAVVERSRGVAPYPVLGDHIPSNEFQCFVPISVTLSYWLLPIEGQEGPNKDHAGPNLSCPFFLLGVRNLNSDNHPCLGHRAKVQGRLCLATNSHTIQRSF